MILNIFFKKNQPPNQLLIIFCLPIELENMINFITNIIITYHISNLSLLQKKNKLNKLFQSNDGDAYVRKG